MASKRSFHWLQLSTAAQLQVTRHRRRARRLLVEVLEDRTRPFGQHPQQRGQRLFRTELQSERRLRSARHLRRRRAVRLRRNRQSGARHLQPQKHRGQRRHRFSLSHFLFTTGGLSRADSGSGLSDPIVVYDEKIGRFIVGDQDVNFSTHVSAFDLAVSKSNNPTTLSTSDWAFYKITTTQTNEDADYPGNFGYNADAFVFTLNMFAVAGTSGTNHVQVVSVNASRPGERASPRRTSSRTTSPTSASGPRPCTIRSPATRCGS